MGYLTPNSLSGSVTLNLTIPDDVLLKAAIVGSITALVFSDNWELYGSQTPQDTAAAMAAAINSLTWGTSGAGGSTVVLAQVHRSGVIGITTTPVKLTYDVVDQDPDNWWNSTNNEFTVPADGVYLIGAYETTANYLYRPQLDIKINGMTTIPLCQGGGQDYSVIANGVQALSLSSGDTVSIYGSSNASDTFTNADGILGRFWVVAL